MKLFINITLLSVLVSFLAFSQEKGKLNAPKIPKNNKQAQK